MEKENKKGSKKNKEVKYMIIYFLTVFVGALISVELMRLI